MISSKSRAQTLSRYLACQHNPLLQQVFSSQILAVIDDDSQRVIIADIQQARIREWVNEQQFFVTECDAEYGIEERKYNRDCLPVCTAVYRSTNGQVGQPALYRL